jgi:hypothetical protein
VPSAGLRGQGGDAPQQEDLGVPQERGLMDQRTKFDAAMKEFDSSTRAGWSTSRA